MGPTRKKMGPARPLTWVKHHPHGHLKITGYHLSQKLTSRCKFFKLWSPTTPASVYSQTSSCLTSLGPRAGGQEPGPIPPPPPPPTRQSEDTRYLVGAADGTGVAAAAAAKSGPSSGSEESKGEKELPEGKGASDSHPCGAGTVKGWGTQVLLTCPSPKKTPSHLSQRLREAQPPALPPGILCLPNTGSKRLRKRERGSLYPRTIGAINSNLSAEEERISC